MSQETAFQLGRFIALIIIYVVGLAVLCLPPLIISWASGASYRRTKDERHQRLQHVFMVATKAAAVFHSTTFVLIYTGLPIDLLFPATALILAVSRILWLNRIIQTITKEEGEYAAVFVCKKYVDEKARIIKFLPIISILLVLAILLTTNKSG